MKKSIKLLALILCIALLGTCLFACVDSGSNNPDNPDNPDNPETPAHTCESVCPECGKCLDAACTDAACANKCAGHTPDVPTLELPYVTSGAAWVVVRPTGIASLTEDETRALIDLFATVEIKDGAISGTANMAMVISGVQIFVDSTSGNGYLVASGELDGKVFVLTGAQIIDLKAVFKARGLAYDDPTPEQTEPPIPEHTCESQCATCGKCLDAYCTDSACIDKCQGHTPTNPNPDTPKPGTSGGNTTRPNTSAGNLG